MRDAGKGRETIERERKGMKRRGERKRDAG